MIFVESPESEREMRAITNAISAPTLANMVEGGRTPFLPAATLREIGYRIVIYPNSLTRTLARSGQRVLRSLSSTGTTQGMVDLMVDHRELWSLFGYEKWTETEQRQNAPQRAPRPTRLRPGRVRLSGPWRTARCRASATSPGPNRNGRPALDVRSRETPCGNSSAVDVYSSGHAHLTRKPFRSNTTPPPCHHRPPDLV